MKKKNKKKKKKSRKSSLPPLVNFFDHCDSDSNDDSRIECYREPEPRTHYEHFDPFNREDMNMFDSTKQPESDKDQQDSNEDHSSSDDVSKSSMPGLQERSRDDSSSEDENSQQNKRKGKKKKTKKRKKKKKEEDAHHWSKEINIHQAAEHKYNSNPHNRVPQCNRNPQYLSDDSDSDSGSENVPELCSRRGPDDNSDDD